MQVGKPAATTDTLPAKEEEETGHRARAKTYASSRSTQEGKGGPKTIRDYQEIAAKKQNKPSRITSPQMDDEEEGEECLPCSLFIGLQFTLQKLSTSMRTQTKEGNKALRVVC